MPPEEQTNDEDSLIGMRLRMRRCEESNQRLEAKVDRIQWLFVAGAVGYLISLWSGIGGGPPG